MDELKPCPYTDEEVSQKLRKWKGHCQIPGLDELILWAADIIDRRPTPVNKPLTLDELRQMDGEQIDTLTETDAINLLQGKSVKFEIATVKLHRHMYLDVFEDVVEYANGPCRKLDFLYTKTWLAYARNPKRKAQ